MILGLHKAALSAAYVLASVTGMCQQPAPPVVHMDFVQTAPVQRNDLSSRDLGSFTISTTFSHSRNEIFTTGGVTVSDFSPNYFVDFTVETDQMTGMVCVSVKSVNITVNYAPTIYVASDFAPDGCRFKSTLQHEARHVNTDIITFNELLPDLRQVVQDATAGIGAIGPDNPANLIPMRDKILDRIKAALVAKVTEIEHTRLARQQLIDTRQEYLRLSNLCAAEPLLAPP